jgi:beta-mannosidase
MRYSLNGEWILRSETLNLQCEGIVPGSVYGDLLRNKLIEDPFDQDNEASARDLMNHDFTYSRTFTLSADDLRRTNYLVCEGIDTLGEIVVNGNLLSTTDNMHRTWQFLLDGFVQEGQNTLEIRLRSCLKYIREKEKNRPYPLYQARDAVRGFIHLRKGSSMFGWDWGPQLPDAGIWRNIFIDSVEGAYLDDVIIRQDHSESDLVFLSITVNGILMKDTNHQVTTQIQLFHPDGTLIFTEEKALNAG